MFCAVRIDNDNNKFLFEVIRTDLPVLFGGKVRPCVVGDVKSVVRVQISAVE